MYIYAFYLEYNIDKLTKEEPALPITIEYAQKNWPNIPFHPKIYQVSSFKNIGITDLIGGTKEICENILDNHSKKIPKIYKFIGDSLKKMEEKKIVEVRDIVKEFTNKGDHIPLDKLGRAIEFLHNIGEIVVLQDRIFLHPSKLPYLMAKFVSPEEVQKKALRETGIEILSMTEIGRVLCTTQMAGDKDSKHSFVEELEMMCSFGVCFQLKGEQQSGELLFLFPSLGKPDGINLFNQKKT